MFKQDIANSNGERTAVGIDPCTEFLQLAKNISSCICEEFYLILGFFLSFPSI